MPASTGFIQINMFVSCVDVRRQASAKVLVCFSWVLLTRNTEQMATARIPQWIDSKLSAEKTQPRQSQAHRTRTNVCTMGWQRESGFAMCACGVVWCGIWMGRSYRYFVAFHLLWQRKATPENKWALSWVHPISCQEKSILDWNRSKSNFWKIDFALFGVDVMWNWNWNWKAVRLTNAIWYQTTIHSQTTSSMDHDR